MSSSPSANAPRSRQQQPPRSPPSQRVKIPAAVSESFEAAVNHHIGTQLNDRVTAEQRNELYGTYKQATQGPCTYERPDDKVTSEAIRDKWKAWKAVSWMTQEQAIYKYIELLQQIDPSWKCPHQLDFSSVGTNGTTPSNRPPANGPASAPDVPPASSPSGGAREPPLFSGVLEGVLYKERDYMKTWRPRHFRLEDQMLHYYLDANDPAPRKSLLLANCTITPLPDMVNTSTGDGDPQKNTFFAFMISHPENSKSYKLAATSAVARNRWVEALTAAAESEQMMFSAGSREMRGESRGSSFSSTVDMGGISGMADESLVEGGSMEGPLGRKIEAAVRRLLELSNSTHFDAIGVKNDVQGFLMPGSRGSCSTARSEGVIPLSVATILEKLLVVDFRGAYDQRYDMGFRAKVMDTHNFVDYIKFKAVWPTSPRDLLYVVHWRCLDLPPLSGNGPKTPAVVLVSFSSPPVSEETAPTKDTVRAEIPLAGWIFRQGTGGHGTHCTYVAQIDLKGSLPRVVLNNVATINAYTVADLRKALESTKGDPNMPIDNAELEKIAEKEVCVTAKPVEAESAAPLASATTVETATATLAAGTAKAEQAPAESRNLSSAKLSVLLMPSVMWYLGAGVGDGEYRAVFFVFGLLFALRYLVKVKLGSPPPKRSVVTHWGEPVGGCVSMRMPVELKRLLKYLDRKRRDTGVEINVTHLTIKAAAIALREMPELNGHLAMGRFYRSASDSVDVSYLFPLNMGGFASVCVNEAQEKPVELVAQEFRALVERTQTNQDPYARRRRELQNMVPALLFGAMEKVLGFLGCELGMNIPMFGVRPHPFGTCTVITPPSEGSDMEIDVHGSGGQSSGSTQTLAPIVITIGGVRVQSGLKGNQMAARPVLHMSASVDLRCATVYEAKYFFERVQQLLRDPAMIDKTAGAHESGAAAES